MSRACSTNVKQEEYQKQGDHCGIKMDLSEIGDRLCGPVVRVPGYRSRGPGSIPGTTRFSQKY
jgi:hypothetical protein